MFSLRGSNRLAKADEQLTPPGTPLAQPELSEGAWKGNPREDPVRKQCSRFARDRSKEARRQAEERDSPKQPAQQLKFCPPKRNSESLSYRPGPEEASDSRTTATTTAPPSSKSFLRPRVQTSFKKTADKRARPNPKADRPRQQQSLL